MFLEVSGRQETFLDMLDFMVSPPRDLIQLLNYVFWSIVQQPSFLSPVRTLIQTATWSFWWVICGSRRLPTQKRLHNSSKSSYRFKRLKALFRKVASAKPTWRLKVWLPFSRLHQRSLPWHRQWAPETVNILKQVAQTFSRLLEINIRTICFFWGPHIRYSSCYGTVLCCPRVRRSTRLLTTHWKMYKRRVQKTRLGKTHYCQKWSKLF